MKRVNIKCPYCGARAFLRPASVVYGERAAPGSKLYVCGNYPACDSYVAAHRTSQLPMGTLADIINNGPKEPTVAQLEQQARGGQPISLMYLAAAAHREDREKKKSVMEQLKSQPKAEHKKTAPKKSAEREI